MRDYCRWRLENRIRNEEDERGDGVAVTLVRVEVVVHPSHCGVGHVTAIDEGDAVHQAEDDDQAAVDAVDDLALFGVAELLVFVCVVDEPVAALLQVVAVRALEADSGRAIFDVCVGHSD